MGRVSVRRRESASHDRERRAYLREIVRDASYRPQSGRRFCVEDNPGITKCFRTRDDAEFYHEEHEYEGRSRVVEYKYDPHTGAALSGLKRKRARRK